MLRCGQVSQLLYDLLGYKIATGDKQPQAPHPPALTHYLSFHSGACTGTDGGVRGPLRSQVGLLDVRLYLDGSTESSIFIQASRRHQWTRIRRPVSADCGQDITLLAHTHDFTAFKRKREREQQEATLHVAPRPVPQSLPGLRWSPDRRP